MKSKLFVTLIFLFSIVPFSFAQKEKAVKDTTAVVESKTTTDKHTSSGYITGVIIGVVFLVGGALLKHSMMKRKFKRTNQYGVEENKSYTKAVTSNTFEDVFICIGQILFYIGVLLICAPMERMTPIIIMLPIMFIIFFFCLYRIIKAIIMLIKSFAI